MFSVSEILILIRFNKSLKNERNANKRTIARITLLLIIESSDISRGLITKPFWKLVRYRDSPRHEGVLMTSLANSPKLMRVFS